MKCLKDVLTTTQDCIQHLHQTIWSLLSITSDEFKNDEFKDTFVLFLISFHLVDNRGQLNPVGRIPPTISQAQWCFRATAAHEIMLRMSEYNDDQLK